MKVLELYPLYERDKVLARYSPTTLKAYALQARLLSEHFNDPDISTLTNNDLKNYLYSLAHLKTESIGHRVRFIRSFFRWAADEGYTDGNISERIREPRIKKRIPKHMTEEDINKLRDACQTFFERALLEVLYCTGCRIGEIRIANKDDIDWNDNRMDVVGKGGFPRTVYFTDDCKEWLIKYLNSRLDNHEALFVTARKPVRHFSVARLRQIIKEIVSRTDIKKSVYPHMLRHSNATTLINNGANIEVIRDLLGHRSLSSTLMYATLSEKGKKGVYNNCFK